jgi:hypothetical protein
MTVKRDAGDPSGTSPGTHNAACQLSKNNLRRTNTGGSERKYHYVNNR